MHTGGWVRLGIMGRDDQCRFSHEDLKRYCGEWDGPSILDIYDVFLEKTAPKPHHPEDWLLGEYRWSRIGGLEWHRIQELVDDSSEILIRNSGRNDSISSHSLLINPMKNSLSLMQILPSHKAKVVYPEKRNQKGVFAPRFSFFYNGISFVLSITDPSYREETIPQEDQPFASGFVALGLTDPYSPDPSEVPEQNYKLVLSLLKMET